MGTSTRAPPAMEASTTGCNSDSPAALEKPNEAQQGQKVLSLLSRTDLLKATRNTERLLRHKAEMLSSNEKKALEKKLVALKESLQFLREKGAKKSAVLDKAQKNLKKKLQFVERKKVQRHLRQCRQDLAILLQTKDKSDLDRTKEFALREQIDSLAADLDYINNFPHNQQYISLFLRPDKNNESSGVAVEELLKRQKKIRQRIQDRLRKEKAGVVIRKEKGNMDHDFFSLEPPTT